jgi:hypothetical protein
MLKAIVGAAGIVIILAGLYFFASQVVGYQASREIAMREKCRKVNAMATDPKLGEKLEQMAPDQKRVVMARAGDCIEYIKSGTIKLD